jgi:hypothetical protein
LQAIRIGGEWPDLTDADTSRMGGGLIIGSPMLEDCVLL